MTMNWSQTPESLTLDYPITSLFFAQGKNKKIKKCTNIKLSKQEVKKNILQIIFLYKLNDVNFANYSEFDDVNNAFVDFSDKLMQAVDGIALYREFRVKGHTEDWFDGEIMERSKSKLEVAHKSIVKLNS